MSAPAQQQPLRRLGQRLLDPAVSGLVGSPAAPAVPPAHVAINVGSKVPQVGSAPVVIAISSAEPQQQNRRTGI